MSKDYLKLPLSKTQALHLIVDFLMENPGAKDILKSFRLIIEDKKDQNSVALWITQEHAESTPLKTVLLAQLNKKRLPDYESSPSNTKPLLPNLPLLLFSDLSSAYMLGNQSSREGATYANLNGGERVIAALGLSAERHWEVAYHLQGHTPPARVAYGKLDGRYSYSLYHVHQNIPLDGVEQAEQLPDCQWLNCYTFEYHRLNGSGPGGHYTIALPDHIVPLRENLQLFGHILLMAPELFGGRKSSTPPDILAVVYEDKHKLILTYTADVDFVLYPLETAQVSAPDDCYFYSLENSQEALDHLHKRIEQQRQEQQRIQLPALEPVIANQIQQQSAMNPKQPIGYELRLQFAHYREFSRQEFDDGTGLRAEAIQHEFALLAQLEIELAERQKELEILGKKPHPILLCFTQHQLPSLVDVLREFPADQLGKVHYAFAGSKDNHLRWNVPEGVHFLYLREPLNEQAIDRLLGWEDHQTTHLRRRYWLDPYWAEEYFNHRTNVELYVPYGMRLWPSLHSWYQKDMNSYLLGLLTRWQNGHEETERIPLEKDVLFVFDGHPSGPDLGLLILDKSEFVPINNAHCISWINTNLHLVLRADHDEVLMKKLRQAIIELEQVQSGEPMLATIVDQLRAQEQTVAEHTNGKNDDEKITGSLRRAINELEQLLTRERATGIIIEQLRTRERTAAEQAAGVYQSITNSTLDIGQAINDELEQLCLQSGEMAKQANDLNLRITDWNKKYNLLVQDLDLVDKAQQNAEDAVEELQQAASQLGLAISQAITEAELEQTKQIEFVVDTKVKLEGTYQTLLEKLATVQERLVEIRQQIRKEIMDGESSSVSDSESDDSSSTDDSSSSTGYLTS